MQDSNFISKDAQIGQNVRFGNFVEIYDNVEIHDNCYIGSYSSIGGPAEHHNQAIDGDYKKVLIGESTIIREHVTINAGFTDETKVGRNCYIMAKSHIGHDSLIANDVTISPLAVVGGHSQIDSFCNLGMGSILHQFTKVNQIVMVGANSFAKGELEAGLIYVGSPAAPVKINAVGIKRSDLNKKNQQEMIENLEFKYQFNL
jgi:UDP-N-acetylglucosamine acyltransferase